MDHVITPEVLENGNILLGLKYQLAQEYSQEHLFALFSCLRDSVVWVPMRVELSQKDQERILNTVMKDGEPHVEPGQEWSNQDQIHMTADILQGPDGVLWFPIFSQQEQMSKEYMENFSAIPMSVPDCVRMAHGIQRERQEYKDLQGIILDAFSDVNLPIPFEAADVIPELPSRLEESDGDSQ